MFSLQFNTNNAAFEDDPAFEIARILRTVADRIDTTSINMDNRGIYDATGNAIGWFEFDPNIDIEVTANSRP